MTDLRNLFMTNLMSFMRHCQWIKTSMITRGGYECKFGRFSIYNDDLNSIWINFEIRNILYQFTYYCGCNDVLITSFNAETSNRNLYITIDTSPDNDIDLTEFTLINGRSLFCNDLDNIFLENYSEFLSHFDKFLDIESNLNVK